MRKSVLLAGVAIAASFIASSGAVASPFVAVGPKIALGLLDTGPFSFQVFDKTFTFTGCTHQNDPAGNCSSLHLFVQPGTQQVGAQLGYGFQIQGLFDFGGAHGLGATDDLSLNYSVAITSQPPSCDIDPSTCLIITDAHLFTAGGTSNGGSATVDENFFSGFTSVGGLHVTLPGNSGDSTFFTSPLTEVDVIKDIGLSCVSAADNSCDARFSVIEQLWTQGTGIIHQSNPEPASLAIFGSALAGVGGFISRRRKRS